MSVEIGSNDGRSVSGGETVAAIDEIDGRPHLVVADISRDDAWIAVSESTALAVEDWE
jgi:MinD superfamily P-loop ATPase